MEILMTAIVLGGLAAFVARAGRSPVPLRVRTGHRR
jgi:hypothetical protein